MPELRTIIKQSNGDVYVRYGDLDELLSDHAHALTDADSFAHSAAVRALRDTIAETVTRSLPTAERIAA